MKFLLGMAILISYLWTDIAVADEVTDLAALCVVASAASGQMDEALWWMNIAGDAETSEAWMQYKLLIMSSDPTDLKAINAAYAGAALTCKQLRNGAES